MSSLYTQSVPWIIQWLKNSKSILEKGEAWAKENGKTEAEIIDSRIIEDMLPLSFQIKTITNQAKSFIVNAIGHPDFELAEVTSYADAKVRIDRVIEEYQKLKASDFEGKETHEFVVTYPKSFKFTGQSYLSGIILPNFYFHITTLYNIFRKLGVPIGKMDYLQQEMIPA